MRNVMTVLTVLACSTAWGQADPLVPVAGFAGGTVLVSADFDAEATATWSKSIALKTHDDAAKSIAAWNPNVGDYTAMADIVLDAPNSDPMLAINVWMLEESIKADVTAMWALVGEAIALNASAKTSYLVGNGYYVDSLFASADVWFARSVGQSAGAQAKMMQSFELRVQILEKVAILLDMVGP